MEKECEKPLNHSNSFFCDSHSFTLIIAFFHFDHRILSLEPSYSFPTPFRMVSKADFIGLFIAVTVIVSAGWLDVAGEIIIHAYIRVKEKPTKSASEIVGLIDLWFRAYQLSDYLITLYFGTRAFMIHHANI